MESIADRRIAEYISEYGDNVVLGNTYNGISALINKCDDEIDTAKAAVKITGIYENYTLLNVVNTEKYILAHGKIAEFRGIIYTESILRCCDLSQKSVADEIKNIDMTKKRSWSEALMNGNKRNELKIIQRLLDSSKTN